MHLLQEAGVTAVVEREPDLKWKQDGYVKYMYILVEFFLNLLFTHIKLCLV